MLLWLNLHYVYEPSGLFYLLEQDLAFLNKLTVFVLCMWLVNWEQMLHLVFPEVRTIHPPSTPSQLSAMHVIKYEKTAP